MTHFCCRLERPSVESSLKNAGWVHTAGTPSAHTSHTAYYALPSQVRIYCIHETLLRAAQFDCMISLFTSAIDLASSLSSSNDVTPDFDNLSTWSLPHPGFVFRSQTVAAFFRGALVGHPAGSGDHRHVGTGEQAWLGLDYVLYLSVIYICIWDVLFMDYIRADERCTVCSACVIWNTSWHDAMIALFVKIPSTII